MLNKKQYATSSYDKNHTPSEENRLSKSLHAAAVPSKFAKVQPYERNIEYDIENGPSSNRSIESFSAYI